MLEPGAILDKYRILAPIAAGGMGVVYKAEHVHLRRTVAIKVLLPNYALDERTRTRFAQEAYVQGQLAHPNIVEVTDFIHAGSVMAFVMRFVDGPSLEQVLHGDNAPWPVEKVIQVLRPVAEGVAYAHARKVIHRDLKPANILLDRANPSDDPGIPRITDFGLAKVLASTGGVTRTGAMLGTIPYMAPEQFRGRTDIDARADVYALAMVFRRLLTGALPVNPDDMEAVTEMYAGRRPLPDLTQMGVQLPPDLDRVLRAAVDPDPGRRPENASCFLSALDAIETSTHQAEMETLREAHAKELAKVRELANTRSQAAVVPPTKAKKGRLGLLTLLAACLPATLLLAVILLVVLVVALIGLADTSSKLETSQASLTHTQACLSARGKDEIDGLRADAVAEWTTYLVSHPYGNCADIAEKRLSLLYRYSLDIMGTPNSADLKLWKVKVCHEKEIPEKVWDCTVNGTSFARPVKDLAVTFYTNTSDKRTQAKDRLRTGYRLTGPSGTVLHAFDKENLQVASGDWAGLTWRVSLPISTFSPPGEYQVDVVAVDGKLRQQRVATTFFTLK